MIDFLKDVDAVFLNLQPAGFQVRRDSKDKWELRVTTRRDSWDFTAEHNKDVTVIGGGGFRLSDEDGHSADIMCLTLKPYK